MRREWVAQEAARAAREAKMAGPIVVGERCMYWHSFHGLREVEVVGVDERGAVEEGGVTYTIDAIATPKFTVDTVRERLSLLV
jgi:hypothetical protein